MYINVSTINTLLRIIITCAEGGNVFIFVGLFVTYRQELPAEQLCRHCFYSRNDFSVFRPTGATRCTNRGEIWWGGADLSSGSIQQIWKLSLVGTTIGAPMCRKIFKIWENGCKVCAHWKSINPCNFQKCFGAFYRGWYVVVHPCSNFSLCRQMAPLQTIKFQTADFPIFCAHIIVIFWTTL